MFSSSSQVTIRVTRDNRTLQTLPLGSAAIVAGRDPSCDIPLEDRMVSRRHCEIKLEDGRTTVTDLDSRNGVLLGESRLAPGKAVSWSPGVPVSIGPFVLQLSVAEPDTPPPSRAGTWRIACGQAKPSVIVLKDKPITIGRDARCDMVLADKRVSRRQCEIRLRGSQVWVRDRSGHASTRIGDEALSGSAPHVWPEGELLHVGPFSLAQSVDASIPATPEPAAPQSMTPQHPSLTTTTARLGSRMWHEWIRQLPWIPITMLLGGACLVLGLGVGVFRLVAPDSKPATEGPATLSPAPTVVQSSADLHPTATQNPTAMPTGTPIPTGSFSTDFLGPTGTPLPTPVCTPQTAGWLDLPFPYDGQNKRWGSAEQFREASQRAVSRGRITSFFDHEYPLYKGRESKRGDAQVIDTMVLFDGSRSLSKWTHPDEAGDYYSGHPGYDFSTYEWRKATTPVLAPAAGTLLGAGTDSYGNNYVLLRHDRAEEGVYQTSFLHLENDEYFERMLGLELGTAVAAGEQIGMMGNTGNSTGHHLHFEVRRDCNDDGKFLLDEAVDPYGFIASVQVPTDPLAALSCGGGKYLWKYTLEPEAEGGGCAQPERRWQLDPAPFHGMVSLSTFIFTTADASTLTPVRIWLTDADVGTVYLGSIGVHRWDNAMRTWIVVEDSQADFDSDVGKFFVNVELNISGKYVVTGEPKEDIIPPTTMIRLTGPQQEGAFVGTISVELVGTDESPEGTREIQYSLDCGQNWETYGDLAFTIVRDDLVACGRAEDSQENEWGLEEDTYMIVAAAVDWAGNWEQPPSQRQFLLTTGASE